MRCLAALLLLVFSVIAMAQNLAAIEEKAKPSIHVAIPPDPPIECEEDQ